MSVWNWEKFNGVVGVVWTKAGRMYSRATTSASSHSQCRQAGGGGGAVRTALSPGGGASGVLLMDHCHLSCARSDQGSGGQVAEALSRRNRHGVRSGSSGYARGGRRRLRWRGRHGRKLRTELRSE